jgi:hypothetical protein
MKRPLARAALAASTLLLAACAAAALAQSSGSSAAPGGRDPLVPPRELYAAQDLPPLRVTVIGFDRQRPERSLAVVRMDTRPPVRRVVYVGDRVGEYRILRIEATRVEVAAPAYGGSARVSLAAGDTAAPKR